MISKQVLKNNVVLISQQVPSAKSVSVGFYFLSAGSRFESNDMRGASHFSEHMLFKGTSGEETALERHDIAVLFDRMGGFVNAFTERDDVCAYCTVPALPGNLHRAFSTFCGMASSCSFDAVELENERSVIQNEVAAVADDAEESALDSLAQSLWPNQSLGMSITGSVTDVASLTREALLDWYDKKFVHGELVVVVCGSFSDEEENDMKVQLESLPLHTPPVNYPEQKRVESPALWNAGTVFKKDHRFSQCQMYLLFPFVMPLSHEKLSVLSVLNAITGDTMSSRLFENLREKNGCCYSTYSFMTCYEDLGFWAAAASCDKKNAVKIARLLQNEMTGLIKNPPSDEEIECAKEHLLGEEFLAGEDMESLMKRNLRHYAMGLDLYDTEQVCDSIRAVQKNDIIQFIQSLLNDKKRTFFVYGPGLSKKQQKEMVCQTV
ncbi:MAG: insulinase family protein [Treponema sp.]|nr:insulinase family protein [Treponema sp.]